MSLYYFHNQGLVDSESEDEFYNKLASLETVWDEREKPFVSANQNPSFLRYINERVLSVLF